MVKGLLSCFRSMFPDAKVWKVWWKYAWYRRMFGERVCIPCKAAGRPPYREGEGAGDGEIIGLGAEDGAYKPFWVEVLVPDCPNREVQVHIRCCPICWDGPLHSKEPGLRGYLRAVKKIVVSADNPDPRQRGAIRVYFEAKQPEEAHLLPMIHEEIAIYVIGKALPMNKDEILAAIANKRLQITDNC